MVVLEASACATPVIAARIGSQLATPFRIGRADAVIVSRRQVGTGGNFHQSVQRFVIDRRTGVALRRQVELIAGTTAARNREVLRITPPGGRP